jgi:hypothetical protein
VQLLPGDKILVAANFSISLYDTSSIAAVTDIPSAHPLTSPHPLPTWRHKYTERRGPGLSQRYCCGSTNEFRLIFTTKDAIQGITIPCRSGKSQPKCVTLMPLNRFDGHKLKCHFGYNSAVVISGVCPGREMLYYSWPKSSSKPSLGCSKSPFGRSKSRGRSNVVEFDEDWGRPEYSAFDECSGRVVVEASDEVVVYDFTKF